jgi:hypothetical protein
MRARLSGGGLKPHFLRVDETSKISRPDPLRERPDLVRSGVVGACVSEFLGDGQLDLSDALKEQLGLEQGESLRVLSAGGRFLTMERVGPEAGTPIPWDRELVMSADVRAFPLADLLKFIHSSRKSGFVLFTHDDHEKTVYLNRGEVVFASSNQHVDRLGESLLRHGTITLEQLRMADDRWSPGVRFGKALVELGVLTPRDLWNAVKSQVEETVRSLFAYTAGSFHFWEGEVQPDNIVRLALPTRRLIAEGLRKRDELFRFLAVLEDPRTRLMAVDGVAQKLSSTDRSYIDALGEERCFQPLCRRIGLDPLSMARTVQLLQLVGALRLEQVEAEPGGSPARDEDAIRECVYDHAKLIGELAAPLVAVDGPDTIRERLERVIEDASVRHAAVLADLPVGPGGALDPDELLARALRQTGDRVRCFTDAMAEVVTYLEFELQNHPRIEDAEVFFEAVEGLRARIER